MQFTTTVLAILSLTASTLAAPAGEFKAAVMPPSYDASAEHAPAAPAQPAAEHQTLNTATFREPVPAGGSNKQLIDVWESPNFLDLKFTGSAQPGDCVNFEPAWNNRAQSGKAKPGFRCTVWFKNECQGQPSFSFNASPGSARFPDEIRKKGSSWKCVAA